MQVYERENMSADWDIQLIDTVKAKMCTGCKFETICHQTDEANMEFTNWSQFCICTDKNVGNTYRPDETPERW